MRSRGALAVALAIVAPCVVPACGSSHGAAGGGADGGPANGDGATFDAAPIALGDLCPLFTQDLCIYLMQCNHAPYHDLVHCEAEVDCYGLPQLQMSAAGGGVIYDPAQVGACNARFLSDPCGFGFFLFAPDIFEVLSYCPGTITPLRKAGDACVSSGECTQGLYCKKDNRCPGVCTPFAQVGESCAGTAQCDPKLDCTTVSTGSDASAGTADLCEPPPKAGDPCSDGSCGSWENCPADPSLCVSAVNVWCAPASNTCMPAAGDGSPCGPPADAGSKSGSVVCASNLWCDQVFLDKPGTCRAASGMGGPCNNTGCSTGLHCAGYVALGPGATLGTCVGPSAVGGPCSSPADCQGQIYCGNGQCGGGKTFGSACQQDTDCAADLTCSANVCEHGVYPGGACDGTTNVCVLSLCRNGTCVDHAKVGQPCTVSADCTTNACYQGACADTSVCPVP